MVAGKVGFDPFGTASYVIASIIMMVLILVGVAVLWAMGLLTAVIIAGVLLLISWAVLKTGAVPTDKYPWAPMLMWIMPVIGFFAGFICEKTRVFYVTPLLQKPEPITPFYGATPLEWLQANPELILLLTVFICLVIVLYHGEKK